MNRHALITGLLLALFSVHSSFACQGSSVILDENFKSPDSGWPSPNEYFSYGPLGAVLKLPPNSALGKFNRHYTSDGTGFITEFRAAAVAWLLRRHCSPKRIRLVIAEIGAIGARP